MTAAEMRVMCISTTIHNTAARLKDGPSRATDAASTRIFVCVIEDRR